MILENYFLKCKKHEEMIDKTKICKKFPCERRYFCEVCYEEHMKNHNIEDYKNLAKYQQTFQKAQKYCDEIAKYLQSYEQKFRKACKEFADIYYKTNEDMLYFQAKINMQKICIEQYEELLKMEEWDGRYQNLRNYIHECENIMLQFENKLEISVKYFKEQAFFIQIGYDYKFISVHVLYHSYGMIFYNIKSGEAGKIKFDLYKSHKMISYPYNSDYAETIIRVNTKIYFIGGTGNLEEFNKTYCMNLCDPMLKIKKLSNLIASRYTTPLVQICGKYIFCIGGKMLKNDGYIFYMTQCERYDISKNIWRNIHPITKFRKYSMVCSFDDRYIYYFGTDFLVNKFETDLEKYDIFENENGWNSILKNKNSNFYYMSDMYIVQQISAMVQTSYRQILVFGFNGILQINLSEPSLFSIFSPSVFKVMNNNITFYPIIFKRQIFLQNSTNIMLLNKINFSNLITLNPQEIYFNKHYKHFFT